MPRPQSFRLLAVLLFPFLALTAVLAGEPTQVSLELNGEPVMIPGLVEEGRTFFSLNGAAAVVGAAVLEDGDGNVRLSGNNAEVTFPEDMPSLASVNGTIISLPAAVIRKEGELFVPVEAFDRILSTLEPSAPVEAPKGAIPVSVRVAGSADELRVELEGASRLAARLRGKGDDLRLTFGKGVFLVPPYTRRVLGGALLREVSFEQAEDGTVVHLRTGPGFRTARVDRAGDGKRVAVVLGGVPAGRKRNLIGAQDENGIHRVVIDPGHGGAEDGAIGPSGVKEKTVTLQVAARLLTLLEAQGFEVFLTRGVDRDLGLDERAAVANSRRADLFISLHANASSRTRARGAETYFLAREATDDEARTTAAIENDGARRGEGSVRSDPDGIDLVLWDLAQVEYLEESAALAETIQEELNKALGIANRGVRQAPFRVLMGATMPAVLVEIGFLSHAAEERLLADGGYQERLAAAIARAVVGFRSSYERRLGVGGASSRTRR